MVINRIREASLSPALLLEPLSIIDKTVANGSYDLDLNASFNYIILQVDCITASGTCDIKFTINGVDVVFDDGASGTETVIGVSSTGKSRQADSAFTVSAGNNLKLVVSNNSTGINMAIKVHIQRIAT